MNQHLILESSPLFLFVCLLVSLGYAFILYRSKQPWGKQLNWVLFTCRALIVFLLTFLLLGPIVKQINNIFEKPIFIVLHDNSGSVKEATDSTILKKIRKQLVTTSNALLEQGYEVKENDLAGEEVGDVKYNATASDINTALKQISNRYENRNIAGVILLSDGIYNAGLSPLYGAYNFPVHTIGLGDTTQHMDLAIKNIACNKITYQGNKFPLRVEVLVRSITNEQITIKILQRGKILDQQSKNSGTQKLLVYDFSILAKEQGLEKIDVQVDVHPAEHNVKNNSASVFIEVVEGKKKILVVASSPHPDIKAFHEVINKNANYEFVLYIPGSSEQPVNVLKPTEIDLAIFYQSPDMQGRTRALFKEFASSKTSLLLVLGQQSDLMELARLRMPIKFITQPHDYDEVTPAINSNFTNFTITTENNAIISDYPPVSVHFGKTQIPLSATPILFQRVGNVLTDKPLIAVETNDERKVGIILGEGIWRWRMSEFDRTENTIAFDELFGKLIQYLSTVDDKRKFRSYPIQQEFADTEPVIFESQVFNDIFEPVFGNSIELDITNESGKLKQFSYVTNANNTRYPVGGLKEGVYYYKARTTINKKVEEVKGEFVVARRQVELQNLTADFDLLKKLSQNTGGTFHKASELSALTQQLKQSQAKSIIHTEEQYNPFINLKWFFLLLLTLIGTEWFLRKYFGSY